ncbi:sensor histidine kinase [Psychromicrobium sp. YIM B11713]|uniref:sensor histidine kinase n=1 Tax=Psychromicrobium sp. YIM B11713 TaxID=3145233 RepID=UPI00374E3BE7
MSTDSVELYLDTFNGEMRRSRAIKLMRYTLHIGFAVLWITGLVGTLIWLEELHNDPIWIPLSLLLVILYVAALIYDYKRFPRKSGQKLEPIAYLWAIAISLVWGFLLYFSFGFSWVGFPLAFFILGVFPRWFFGIICCTYTGLLLWLVWPYYSGKPPGGIILLILIAMILGIIADMVFKALLAETAAHRKIALELINARSELAARQHEAGVRAERNRIATEIHDTLTQGFAGISLLARKGKRAVEKRHQTEVLEDFSQIQELADENLAEARRFVRGFLPQVLARKSLVEAIEEACRDAEASSIRHGKNIEIGFTVIGGEMHVAAAIEAAILRAAQSCLANILQHSRASRADVTLSFFDQELTLDIFDDGIGFDVASVAKSPVLSRDGSGLGLKLLEYRVSLLGGELKFTSQQNYGTVVTIRLPSTPPGDPGPGSRREAASHGV